MGRLVVVIHVVVTQGHDEGIVAVDDTAGARSAIGRVDCSDAAMEDKVVSVSVCWGKTNLSSIGYVIFFGGKGWGGVGEKGSYD